MTSPEISLMSQTPRRSSHALLKPLSLILCLAALLATPLAAAAQTAPALQARITAPIDNSARATLAGSHPPRALPANDIGAVPSSMQLQGVSLVFSRTAAQQTALDALVAAQQNPASPLYHQWITPDQYAAQFGVAPADITAVQAWLEQQGFSVDSVSRSHNRILFSGTAGQVAAAFGASLHFYLTPGTATRPAITDFAPSADLTIPSALSSSVLSIGNLSSFRPRSQLSLRHTPPAQPAFTSSQTGSHFLTPGDIATIYDITPAYNSGFTGSNQSIAVIGQSGVILSDIANFQSAVGIAGKTPIPVLVPGTGNSQIDADGDEAESDLDLEYSSTIAKGAQVYFVFTGNSANNGGAFESLQYAIDERIAPIVSSSYGVCEPALENSSYTQLNVVLEQAAAQGQTVISAAGDAGSTDCFGEFKASDTTDNEQIAVDFPASSQYVTAMGGSEFPAADVASTNSTYFDAKSSTDIVSSAKSYIPEMVWNDDSSNSSNPLASGGGGVSIFTARPSWQTGTIGGVAIPSGGNRLVPDISLTASPLNAPFAFCTSDPTFWSQGQQASCNDGLRDSASQSLTVGGGTSFDAPIFSGLVAIINQSRNSTGQGVINPTLYSLAATSSVYSTAFHDITSGGNQCDAGASSCSSPGTTDYAAATGYDEASGLGSIDFNNLLTAWPTFTATTGPLSTSTTLTAATGIPAVSATVAVTITVAPLTANAAVPTGTVTVAVDNGTPTSLPLTAGVASYSFSSATTGEHVLTALYSGDTTFAASTGTLTLNVGGTVPAPSFSIAATSVAVTPGASGTGTIAITPANGYTGTVNLIVNSSSLTDGCITLSPTAASVTGTAAVNSAYTINTSSAACTTSAAARPGSGTLARNATHPRQSPWKQLPLPASLAGALLFVCVRRRSRTLLRAGLTLGLLLALSLSGLALTGCGGGTTVTTPAPAIIDTPAGTYTIMVTGTDSKTPSITSSYSFTVIVS